MAVKRNNVAIIGLGSFGEAVARDLAMMGDRILGIDIDANIVSRFADEIDAVIQADASDLKALAECSLENYDAVVVSIGENTVASILAAVNVLKLGCKDIWVKAQSATHKQILEAVGIRNVVLPEQAYGERIAQVIHNPKLIDYLGLGDGYYLANVALPKKYVGARLDGLKLNSKFSISCVGIWRNGTLLDQDFGATKLLPEDSLLLCGRTRDLRHFADI